MSNYIRVEEHEKSVSKAYKKGLIVGALAVLIVAPIASWLGYNIIGPLVVPLLW